MSKIVTGASDRSTDISLAQSGSGLPDDSSMPVEATEEEALQIQSKLAGTEKENAADALAEQLARPKHGMA